MIHHALPGSYLELIEKFMEFDEETGEWFIQGLDEYLHLAKKVDNTIKEEPKQMLAMGFNDDEECKQIK